ncbi:MAG: hypothetical protein WAV28_16640 [Sedimentisphaerales bacterium]
MTRSNLGNVYRSKRWAERWARGRPIRKVPGGWMICRGRRRKARKGQKYKSRKKRKSKRYVL